MKNEGNVSTIMGAGLGIDIGINVGIQFLKVLNSA